MVTHPANALPRNPKALAVGARIANAREQKGYTQVSLGDLVGVTSGAIAQYETGRNLPKLERLEQIALALGVSTEWLLTGDEPEELVKAQTKTEETALRLVRGLPAEQQAAAIAMLEGLAARHTEK